MLTPRRAGRLVQRARSGGRWSRGGWARRRLARAGTRGDPAAVDAVWAEWLARPTGALWELLDRWRRPGTGDLRGPSLVALGGGGAGDPAVLAAAVHAAGRTGHPIADAARRRVLAGGDQRLVDAVCAAAAAEPAGLLAGLCRTHRLAPADPAARAVYFLLTGQDGQRRAEDPDGHLLAAGYAAADPEVRAAVRAAMVHTDLDLVRVVAGERRARVEHASDAEVGYLAAQLATRRAWDELWRLTVDVSPARMVELVRLFPPGWAPADDRGRALHAVLLATPAGAVRAAAPAAVRHGQITVTGYARAVVFSADGTRLAVVEHAAPWQSGALEHAQAWVGLYELSTLELRLWRQLRGPFAALSRVLPLGDRVLASTGPRNLHDHRLDVVSAAGRTTALADLYYPTDPLPLAAGFALGDLNRLLLGSADGTVGRTVRWHEIAGRPDVTWSSLATDPVSGRLAVGGRNLYVLDVDAEQIAAAAVHPPGSLDWIDMVAFAGADRLITCGRSPGPSGVTAWRLAAASPAEPAELIQAAELTRPSRPQLTVLPAHRLVLVDDAWHRTDTLSAAAAPAGLGSMTGRLRASPTGEWAAFTGEDGVSVFRIEPAAWVADLTHRPLVTAGPDDLARVAAEQRRVDRSDLSALLELLSAGLEHRFGAEIAVGPPPHPSTRDDDVAVAAPEHRAGSAGGGSAGR